MHTLGCPHNSGSPLAPIEGKILSRVAHIVWTKLTGLMPGELNRSELVWLLSPHAHFSLLTRRRATMIVNRVRLFAFLFAALTPLWTVIDYFVFPTSLWLQLAALRLAASFAFILIVVGYRPAGSLGDAYRAMALLFAVPTVFYVASHQILTGLQLAGLSAALATGYAFLPFVLLAGLAIFPLTFVENLLIASPILFAQALSGYMRWATLDWPSFAGAFWLLTLITGVSNLAGMSQLAFMIALVRQAIRDPLTSCFSRSSGEETLEMQFTLAQRSNAPLAVAFIDLDHFKSVNDTYGHEAGDRVLSGAATRIADNLRRGDMLVRWGGRGVRADPAEYGSFASAGGTEPAASDRFRRTARWQSGDGEHRHCRKAPRECRGLAATDRSCRPPHVSGQDQRARPDHRQLRWDPLSRYKLSGGSASRTAAPLARNSAPDTVFDLVCPEQGGDCLGVRNSPVPHGSNSVSQR